MLTASQRHLAEVDEAYGEHCGAALGIARALIAAGLACAVHALIPALCMRSASRRVARIHALMTERGRPTAGRSNCNDLTATPRSFLPS